LLAISLNFHENELLRAIACGLTTKAIAAELKMTEATTETYRVRLMKKLGVPNTAALLAMHIKMVFFRTRVPGRIALATLGLTKGEPHGVAPFIGAGTNKYDVRFS
jgi:DNA-binding CsgD family transcriptional regulator